jgi:hypothetical protein
MPHCYLLVLRNQGNVTSQRRKARWFSFSLAPSCLLSVIRVALASTQPSLPASHLTSSCQSNKHGRAASRFLGRPNVLSFLGGGLCPHAA